MAFNHMNLNNLQTVADGANDELFTMDTNYADAVTTDMDLVLVNGQYQPIVSATAGVWQRWRMVLASVEQQLYITVPGCELQLLAKDGIYLDVAPRTVTTIYLAPGNRADVAVRCSAAGSYDIVSSDNGKRRRSLLQRGGGGGGGPGGGDIFAGTIGTVEVTGAATADAALVAFSATRPCYLVDLQGVPADSVESGFLLDLGPPPNINGLSYTSSDTYITTMDVAKVHEWAVEGERHALDGHIPPPPPPPPPEKKKRDG